LDACGYRDDSNAPLFQATKTARGRGRDGWSGQPLSTRAVQNLLEKYKRELGIDAKVSVHSIRVTAASTARRQGVDVFDLKEWLGHSTAEVTQRYIRVQQKLSDSPSYVIQYR